MKKSILAGIAATACWGFSNVVSKILLAHFEPLSLLAIQLLASNLLLWTFIAFQQKSNLSKGECFKYSLPGILQPGFAFTFGVFGLNLTTANNEGLIWASETIIIIFLAWLLLREQISWHLVILAICGTCGTLLATVSSSDVQFNMSMLFGNMLIFAGVICAALYNICTERQLIDIEPLRLTALHQFSGLVFVIAIWLISLPILGVGKIASGLDFLIAIVSGITQNALPFFLYLIAIKNMGAAKSSILLVLPPIFTICGSFILLGERLNCLQCLGVLIALSAVGGICISKTRMVTSSKGEVTPSRI
jgi:drug/metabolite transporter (DMT)-like permease